MRQLSQHIFPKSLSPQANEKPDMGVIATVTNAEPLSDILNRFLTKFGPGQDDDARPQGSLSPDILPTYPNEATDIISPSPIPRISAPSKDVDGIARVSSSFTCPDANLQPPSTTEQAPRSPALPTLTDADYIQAEVFLENAGFFTPSSKRLRGITIKEKIVEWKSLPDGSKAAIKTKFRASAGLGLPITSDLDYYRAFLKICDELVDSNGRFRLPFAVPSNRLIRYAGKSGRARDWKEARDFLKRMTFTGIEGGMYRAKSKDFQEGFMGTVFSQVVIKGDRMKDGSIAETNYVWVAPWFLSNYFYRHTRSIDHAFHLRLRKPIAKSLYPLLETGWYASKGEPYSKSYHALCQEFLLREYRHHTMKSHCLWYHRG